MLSEGVEVFDHVPYRFDGGALFAKYLNEVVKGLAISELRLPATIVPRVWRYRWYRKCPRHVYGSNERRQGPVHPRPNHFGLHQTKRAMENCERSLLSNTQGSLRIEPGHMGA